MADPSSQHRGAAVRRADGFLIAASGWVDPGAPPARDPFGNADGADVLTRFDAAVARHPDRIAVEDGHTTLSFAQLQRCVDGFAGQIAEAAPPDRPVAAVLHNSATFPAVLLAVLASGRVFVPVDASHPPERQQAILREVRPGLIVSAADRPVDLSYVFGEVPTLTLDLAAPGAPVRPKHARTLDDPVAIGFTSGSIGRAKGIVVSEFAYLSIIGEHIDACALGPDDVVLGLATLSAAGIRECLAANLSGARLRLVDFKADGLARALVAAADATVLTFAPSIMRTVLAIPAAREAFARLRLLSLGGESLARADIDAIREALPDARVLFEMGSTEATSVFRWFVRENEIAGTTAPVGRIARDQAVAIVDESGAPVPDGETGELVVKGRRLALGLWRDGDPVAGPLAPASDAPGERIYHTGDLIRLRPDGLAEFVGRRDRMIKLNGKQVSLPEVEGAMFLFPNIAEAVALPVSVAGGPSRLVAFVTTRDGAAVDAVALRRHVAAETADHMAPAQILVVDAVPRLANNKPDLRRLEAMALAAAR